MTATIDTYSEAWRHECEARHVAGLRSVQNRRDYLDAVTKRRGQRAGDALRAKVAEVWASRHQPEPQSPSQGAGAGLDATRNEATVPPDSGSFPYESPAGNSNPRGPLGNEARA